VTDKTAPAYAQFVPPIMERDFGGRWAANLRFTSMEAALAWYDSSPRSGSSNASTPTQRPATTHTGQPRAVSHYARYLRNWASDHKFTSSHSSPRLLTSSNNCTGLYSPVPP
jgi:hypothetical protein